MNANLTQDAVAVGLVTMFRLIALSNMSRSNDCGLTPLRRTNEILTIFLNDYSDMQ